MSKNQIYQRLSVLKRSRAIIGSGLLLSATFASFMANSQTLTLEQAVEQVSQYQTSQQF